MSAQQWFIEEEGIEDGPFNVAQLRRLVSVGRVVADTPVRHDGMPTFVPARKVTGLIPASLGVPARVPVAVEDGASAAPDVPPLEPPVRAEKPSTGFDPAAPADSLFENVAPARFRGDGTSVRRYAPAAAANDVYRAAALLGTRSESMLASGLPLAQPAWTDLWPLAALCLAMGWIIGGFATFQRMFVPGTVFPILLLALGGVPFAFAAIIHYLRPRRIPVGTAVGVLVSTAVAGVILLLVLQSLAGMAAHSHRMPHGRGAVVWAILAAIGTAYDWINSDSVVMRWFGFVFGVGLCEETTKLLPLVMLILWRSDRAMSAHAFLFLGFASGVGFGIGEALYGYAPWTGNYALGSNIIRWYGAVPSHAIYTTVCAAFLWKLAERLEHADGFWGRAGVVAMAAGGMAVVHGTYDTVCSTGIAMALLMEILSFALLIWAVRWVTADATEPAGSADGPATPWAAALADRKPMYVGAGAALLLLSLSAALSSSREDALPKVIESAVPAAYRPYVKGVEVTTDDHGASLSIPVTARFRLAIARGCVVGTFTNAGASALHHLVITCTSAEEGARRFEIGDLEGGSSTVIDDRLGWSFAPGESVTLTADERAAETMRLP